MESWQQLRGRAEKQHGLFTTREAAEFGVKKGAIHHRIARGEVEQLARSVFRFTGGPRGTYFDLALAVKCGGPRSVASFDSALWLFGLGPRPASFDVTTPAAGLPLGREAHYHRTRRLDSCDHTVRHGVPVTAGGRTLVDSGTRRDQTDLIGLVDRAICAKVVRRQQLHRRATALRRGRTGVDVIIRVTAPGAEAYFRSWLEREAARLLRDAGVPQPEWNVPVHDEQGFIGEVDAFWRAADVVVELEGLRFHTSPQQRRKDAARFNRLGLRFGTVLRYTWQDVVRRPDYVVNQIRGALGR